MSDGSLDRAEQQQALSALADGELDPSQVARTCAAWRDAPEAREAWHAYHLIGDVLRSEDLATDSGGDADFLARLRTRLAREPVVLAPDPLPERTPMPAALPMPVPERQRANGAPAGRWQRLWTTPLAVVAGFVVVAGALVATRNGPVQAGGAQLAAAGHGAGLLQTSADANGASAADADDDTASADPRLIRDAQLDRYLAAHREYGSNAVVLMPGATLRNAAAYVPER